MRRILWLVLLGFLLLGGTIGCTSSKEKDKEHENKPTPRGRMPQGS